MPQATEAQEQEALFRWIAFAAGQRPALRMMYHIPNEGKRSATLGAAMKRQGLRPGVPDLCLPVAAGGQHGLYIELKARNGKASESQKQWLEDLRDQGYAAEICHGWEAAKVTIENYLGGHESGK
jgi:hypothetical protein